MQLLLFGVNGMTEFKLNHYRGKKVLVTGHTGFKGSWLCQMLLMFGAEVIGYGLESKLNNVIFSSLELDKYVKSYYGDIRNLTLLEHVFAKEKPEYVFHLAAQSLVLPSYMEPVDTYSTNVMGTVHVCECVRKTESVKSFVNVTTDKVYENKEWIWGYRENEALNGYDPYSNSKSCSELVTSSYKQSFFDKQMISVSTARAGNVIGGGDRCENRIIPDSIRARINKESIIIRNPNSVRPYQHVLEPLYAYLLIGMQQSKNIEVSGSYNVGPESQDCVSTQEIVELFCESWSGTSYEIKVDVNQPHEANFLRLDSSLIKKTFCWKPICSIKKAVEMTVLWEQAFLEKKDMILFTTNQINEYIEEVINEKR